MEFFETMILHPGTGEAMDEVERSRRRETGYLILPFQPEVDPLSGHRNVLTPQT